MADPINSLFCNDSLSEEESWAHGSSVACSMAWLQGDASSCNCSGADLLSRRASLLPSLDLDAHLKLPQPSAGAREEPLIDEEGDSFSYLMPSTPGCGQSPFDFFAHKQELVGSSLVPNRADSWDLAGLPPFHLKFEPANIQTPSTALPHSVDNPYLTPEPSLKLSGCSVELPTTPQLSPKKRCGRKRKQTELSLDKLHNEGFFDLPIGEAAKRLHIGRTALNKRCRELGVPRWPFRKRKSLSNLLHDTQHLLGSEGEAIVTAIKEEMEGFQCTEVSPLLKSYRQANFKLRHLLGSTKPAPPVRRQLFPEAPREGKGPAESGPTTRPPNPVLRRSGRHLCT